MRSSVAARLVLVLAVLEVVLAVGSWVLSVLLPGVGVRSLLGGEGIRWFFGGFAGMLASAPLAWLVVCASAWGCLCSSGFGRAVVGFRHLLFRERVAFVFAVVALMVFVAFVAALALSPHAVLLSASGRLFPSPFSVSLVPVTAFGVVLCSVVYGVASGRFMTVADVFKSLYLGIEKAAPLFILYIVLIQFYYSVEFVFLQNPHY